MSGADRLHHAVGGTELWPALAAAIWVLALFALGVFIAREFEPEVRAAVAHYGMLGMLIFVGTSVVAVLLPLLTNLPLVPLAVLAWGPWWTAALLLGGWALGSVASFALGRYSRDGVMRRFPSVRRHAGIDRLIDPQRRLLSLVMLRLTFPVDVLSYALGLFSPRTTLAETALSTLLGAAPFAVLFALFPTLPASAQAMLFVLSTLAFAAYARWVWRGPAR